LTGTKYFVTSTKRDTARHIRSQSNQVLINFTEMKQFVTTLERLTSFGHDDRRLCHSPIN
jgi:hypothetical protein